MNKINLASLNIDVTELTKSTAKVKADLDAVKKKNKELNDSAKETGEDVTQAQVENEVAIRKLSKAYSDNMKVLLANTQASEDLAGVEKILESTMSGEIATINEARANIALLTRVRNETNTSTEEGKQALDKINKAINANNDYVKENGDAYLKLKFNIGNYKESIIEAYQEIEKEKKELEEVNLALKNQIAVLDKSSDEWKILNQQIINNNTQINIYTKDLAKARGETEDFNDSLNSLSSGGLSGFIQSSQQAGGAGNFLKTAFSGMTAGLMGLVKAGIAFIATPIGAVLAVLAVTIGIIVGAFKFMVSSMSKTEEGSNKLAKVMAIFTGVLNAVMKSLKPLAEFIFKTFVSALESAIAIGEKVVAVYSKVARALGLDGIADGIDNMVASVKENVKQAEALAQAEAKLTEARRKGRLIQLEYQKQAEKLRQLRDDESKSIPERIALNNQLGAVLKKQLNEELAIAKQALNVANLRIKAEGASTENLDQRAEALTEISDIQERITGQESEQLSSLNSLRKESADKTKELRDNELAQALARSTQLLDALKRELGERAHSVDEELALLDKIAEKQKQVAQDQYNTTKKTTADKLKLENDLANADIERLKARTELVIELADREVEIYKDSINKQLEDGKNFNQELLNQKLIYLDELSNREAEANRLRFENGLINAQQYNDELLRIDSENLEKRNALIDENRLAEQSKQLTDLENKKVVNQTNFEALQEIEKQQNAIKLQQELADAEKSGADITIIKEKYAELDKNIDKSVNENRVNLAYESFGNVAKLAGEQTAVGKAMAIAQATIDTYKGAVSAYSAMSGIPIVGPALGAVAAGVVVASGLASIKKIASTKTPKAKKGATIKLGGNSHNFGGNTLYDSSGNAVIEAEKDELLGVMNKNASSHFMGFNDAFLNGGSQTLSSSGGEISSTIKDGNNVNAIGSMFAEAVRNLPPPIVTVQDINYGLSENQTIVNNGNL